MAGSTVTAPPGPLPRVTCVIIFFNEERFLEEAINSVLDQSYGDWELLLVDDGSTDQSARIAKAVAEEHIGKVRYLCHESGANRGKSASRNLGLREARGDLVAFLDGDDVWLTDKLQRQVALFDRHPESQMVCGATLYWHRWNQATDQEDLLRQTGEADQAPPLMLDRLYQPRSLIGEFYPIGNRLTTSQSGYMIRRDFAFRLGGFESEFRMLFEDLLFLTKIFFEGTVYVSSQCFDKYRQHCRSSSNTATRPEWNASKVQYLKWLQDYLDGQGFEDSAIRKSVRHQIFRLKYPRVHAMAKGLARKLPPIGGST